jgi:hypothetical protein
MYRVFFGAPENGPWGTGLVVHFWAKRLRIRLACFDMTLLKCKKELCGKGVRGTI